MLHVLRVIFYSKSPCHGSCHVCVTYHINGAYISVPSSVHYSFQVGKQQCPRQCLTYQYIWYKQNVIKQNDTQQKV